MTRRIHAAAFYTGPVIILLSLLTACDAVDNDDEMDRANAGAASAVPAGVRLPAQARENLGIATEALQAATYQEVREGPARVLNTRDVIQALSGLASARAAAEASNSAMERARKLFDADTAGSLQTLESARRQAASDRAQLDVARSGLVASFGAGAPWQGGGNVDDFVNALLAGEPVLVRAGFPDGLPGNLPPVLSLRRIGSTPADARWSTENLWTGPADPEVPGPVVFAYLENGDGLYPGDRLTAFFARGEPMSGIRIPRSAVVYAGGVAWCYVFQAPDAFQRRPVAIDRPDGEGYFQVTGFAAGDRVVTAGAGLLLASETAGAGGEED